MCPPRLFLPMCRLKGHHINLGKGLLEENDIEEALNAANAIGDDRLQKEAQGYVVPESFTHGTAAQRTSWFERGLTNGTIGACDTFGAFGTI